jgi:hypothetical protein
VNISPATSVALREFADQEGGSVTDALGRLVSYGILLYRAARLEDKEILLRSPDGSTELVMIL